MDKCTKLTPENLKKIRACQSGIDFAEMHGLEKYSLEQLDIRGDYKYYVKWVADKMTTIHVFDSNNNIISRKNPCGYTDEYTYDSNNNKSSFNNSHGYTEEYTYDKNNNMLSSKDSNGYTEEYTYDKNGNMTSYADSNDVNYSTENLPKGVLCRVFKRDEIILEIRIK